MTPNDSKPYFAPPSATDKGTVGCRPEDQFSDSGEASRRTAFQNIMSPAAIRTLCDDDPELEAHYRLRLRNMPRARVRRLTARYGMHAVRAEALHEARRDQNPRWWHRIARLFGV